MVVGLWKESERWRVCLLVEDLLCYCSWLKSFLWQQQKRVIMGNTCSPFTNQLFVDSNKHIR